MKKFLGFALAVLVLTGCEATEMLMWSHNPLVGKWTPKNLAENKQVITFRKDYIFEVDLQGDGTKDLWGRYDLYFDQRLTLVNEGDEGIPNDCFTPGTYNYRVSGNILKFIEIGDGCSSRRESLRATWQKIPRN